MIKTHHITLLLKDIRFLIVLFFVLRLFTINSPIFDSHNWRQADGYSIARNFYDIDGNILYPRVDHAGDLTGITGSEFPIMNYVVYLSYYISSIDWWQGRLLNLLLSSLGCFFLFKILNQFISQKIAFTATLFLITSLWFSHSRKFMPDVFSASLVIIGVYYGWRYLKDHKSLWYLLFYFILLTLGLLSKLPAIVMIALVTPALFDNTILIKRKMTFMLVSVVALVPVLWWYFYWAPKLTTDFGYAYFFMGNSIATSFGYLLADWHGALQRFYVDALSYIGFGLYGVGIVLLVIKKEIKLLLIFISGSLILLAFMLKGGMAFAHHTYYIIPFVPIMAIVAAYGVSYITLKWLKYAIVLSVMVENIANLQHDMLPHSNFNYRLQYEQIANQYTAPTDLIANNNAANPSTLYLAHRKGWSIPSDYTQANFDALYDKGCQLIIWDKHQAPAVNSIAHYNIVEHNDDVVVYLRE